MATLYISDVKPSVYLVNADMKSLPCMLCSASADDQRFVNMRSLLEHFTNDHLAIHLYGCHTCNQAMSSYADFLMHSCITKKEDTDLKDPKFTYCYSLLICSDCGIQFLLNGGVANDQSIREYLSLMAVHNSSSMKLICVYSTGLTKKPHFYVNYNKVMSNMDFLCKSDSELEKCCPSLCPKYYDHNSVGLAVLACTFKESECLELISVSAKIKSVSIEDVLSPLVKAENKIRKSMRVKKPVSLLYNSNTNNSDSFIDENNVFLLGDQQTSLQVRLDVSNHDTCIPSDILKGFLFETDIYECAGCRSIFGDLESIQKHYKQCRLNKSMPMQFDVLNPRCARMVFNKDLDPSSRVMCGECPNLSFCSFIGLRLHYAQEHSLFVTDDHFRISNKRGINSYGWDIVADHIKNNAVTLAKKSILDKSKTMTQQFENKWANGYTDGRFDRYTKKELNLTELGKVPFTRCDHRRRSGETNLEDLVYSIGENNTERSLTPASSVSELPRRRAPLEVETDVRLSIGRSVRSRVSPSPLPIEEHNSSTGSIDQRKRPPSERAKRMELKKLERERREIADAEKEDKERERRRRRNRQQDDDMLEMGNTNSFHAFNGKETEPYQMEMEVARKRVRKDPEESKANKVEVIDLSDESDSEQQEMPTQPSKPNATDSNLFCFFCGQDIVDTVQYVHHLARHADNFRCCPICIVTSSKEHYFKHVLHVVDHIIEKHIRMDNNHCVCPFCQKDFGLLQHRQPLYLCFQHILFSCEISNYCMVCLATNDSPPHKLRESFASHNNEKHTLIYNRFICSKCLCGFPTKFSLLDHVCSYTYRCTCNVGRPFENKHAFIDHTRNRNEEHHAIKPMSGTKLGIYLPNSYRRQLKTWEIESSKKRRINHPERNDYFLFFGKYPHLFVAFEPLSTLAKNLEIIKVLPTENHSRKANLISTESLKDAQIRNRVRLVDTNEIRPQGAEKALKRKRRRVNADGSERAGKKVVIETARCQRSNVWELVNKYGDEYKEVADILEDLILSVSDNATMFANGLHSLNKSRYSSKHSPVKIPTARQLIISTENDLAQTRLSQLPQLTRQAPSAPPVLAPLGDLSPISQNEYADDKTPSLLPYGEESESDDEEIEIIGEVKRMPPQLLPQIIQHPNKTYLLYPRNRIINLRSGVRIGSTILKPNTRPAHESSNNGGISDSQAYKKSQH